jgi:hypothetical protein
MRGCWSVCKVLAVFSAARCATAVWLTGRSRVQVMVVCFAVYVVVEERLVHQLERWRGFGSGCSL